MLKSSSVVEVAVAVRGIGIMLVIRNRIIDPHFRKEVKHHENDFYR